jgi:hypothetical protein
MNLNHLVLISCVFIACFQIQLILTEVINNSTLDNINGKLFFKNHKRYLSYLKSFLSFI